MDIPDEQARTGHRRVDDVVASLEQLDELPVDDHVGVFERAHSELRGALDEDPLANQGAVESAERAEEEG